MADSLNSPLERGEITALPNAGQWLPLPASDTNADADYNSATSILLSTTGNPLSSGKGFLSHCPVCSADCKARPVQPSSTDEIETSFFGFIVISFCKVTKFQADNH
jgi:hypothetical protein